MSYFRTSGEGDNEGIDIPVEDFDLNDPDTVIVHYDLGAWTADDQAELTQVLATEGIPHAWGDVDELLVPESAETRADAILADLEVRLGVGIGILPVAQLADGDPTVEYDLSEWPEGDRAAIARTLGDGTIRHRWDGDSLLVAADDEDTVDAVLDAVERGDVVGDLDVSADDDDRAEIPFETLTTFFLAGERLSKNALDADGLTHLLSAVDVADPAASPYGVDRGLWTRACALADELAGALADGDEPDAVHAEAVAGQLRDLLRAYV